MSEKISPLAIDIAAVMEKHNVPLVSIFQAIEVLREAAKEPYPDSDPASLLKTLRCRAKKVLAIIDNEERQSTPSQEVNSAPYFYHKGKRYKEK